MNLNFELLDKSIPLNKGTILTLEDPNVFSRIAQNIFEYQEDGNLKIYGKNYEAIKESQLMIVTDIMNYTFNSPTMLKSIYSDLEAQINDNPQLKSEIEQISLKLSEILSKELFNHELNLSYTDLTIYNFLKMYEVKIQTRYVTLFDKCLELIQIYKYLTKKKLLIFINICSYFSKKEMKELLDFISLLNTNVLFIEPKKVYEFKQYILDEDYFLFKPIE